MRAKTVGMKTEMKMKMNSKGNDVGNGTITSSFDSASTSPIPTYRVYDRAGMQQILRERMAGQSIAEFAAAHHLDRREISSVLRGADEGIGRGTGQYPGKRLLQVLGLKEFRGGQRTWIRVSHPWRRS